MKKMRKHEDKRISETCFVYSINASQISVKYRDLPKVSSESFVNTLFEVESSFDERHNFITSVSKLKFGNYEVNTKVMPDMENRVQTALIRAVKERDYLLAASTSYLMALLYPNHLLTQNAIDWFSTNVTNDGFVYDGIFMDIDEILTRELLSVGLTAEVMKFFIQFYISSLK